MAIFIAYLNLIVKPLKIKFKSWGFNGVIYEE